MISTAAADAAPDAVTTDTAPKAGAAAASPAAAAPPAVSGRPPVRVCHLDDLLPYRGAAALVNGEQVALFRVGGEVLAVQQFDPYSGAHVMSRGILGTRGGRLTLAGPTYKQVFDLRTGECVDPLGSPAIALRTWRAEVCDDGCVTVCP